MILFLNIVEADLEEGSPVGILALPVVTKQEQKKKETEMRRKLDKKRKLERERGRGEWK